MSIFQEFKTFALKGNMIDMAVGIIIGAAFGKVVSSLVSDVIMPPLGLLLGGMNFSSFAFTLKQAAGTEPAILLKYGDFINNAINFLIVSIAIFFVIKAMNRLRGEQPPEPTTKDCSECLMAIPLSAKKCGHCGSKLAD